MTNTDRIVNYISQGANPGRRIGLELEHFVYDEEDRVISYSGMRQALEQMAKALGSEASLYEEDGLLLGVVTPEFSLSLEPGMQLEISIRPCESTEEIREIYQRFRRVADEVLGSVGFALHEEAVLPFVESGERKPEELPLLPKQRYQEMDRYFETAGTAGRYMMRATASTQISLDFSSREDALCKLRVLEKLTPLVELIFENSSGITRDRRWKRHAIRAQIWRGVDGERCGYLPGSLKDYSLEQYAEYVYRGHPICLKDRGRLVFTGNQTAAQWYGDREMDGAEYLLSMYFPHVRLKQYLEYRAADSMPIGKALGYARFLFRAVYNRSCLEALDELFGAVNRVEELYEAEDEIFEKGYRAKVYGRPVKDWIREVFEILTKDCDPEGKKQLNALIPLPVLEEIYCDLIRGRESEHSAEEEKIVKYLKNSTAKYHERVVRTLYLPKLFCPEDIERFRDLIQELYGIFDKVIAEYRRNPDYRRLFGFPPELEKLILQESAYTCRIPMARIDIFYDESTREFKFCEFNTDGASAMNEDRELNNAFRLSRAYKEFTEKFPVRSFELFESWVDTAVEIFRDFRKDSAALPKVGIVDFMENATTNEFLIFRDAFRRKGCDAVICDIRKLRFDGEKCYDEEGQEINLIYRRAVTSDVMAHLDEVGDFLEAFYSRKVCVLGEFQTQIVHNKILYKILHLEETGKVLTAGERRFVRSHIPYTMALDELFEEKNAALLETVRKNKDGWIIKPEDSYGSKGVHAGVEILEEESWEQILEEARGKQYILQEFCKPYRLDNLSFQDESFRWTDTANLTGLFVYGGRMSGIYSRISFQEMISTQYNEMALPTMVVEW